MIFKPYRIFRPQEYEQLRAVERALEAEMEHHLVIPKTRLQVKIPVIPAMGKQLKPFALFMVNLSWKSPVTGIVLLNLSW